MYVIKSKNKIVNWSVEYYQLAKRKKISILLNLLFQKHYMVYIYTSSLIIIDMFVIYTLYYLESSEFNNSV